MIDISHRSPSSRTPNGVLLKGAVGNISITAEARMWKNGAPLNSVPVAWKKANKHRRGRWFEQPALAAIPLAPAEYTGCVPLIGSAGLLGDDGEIAEILHLRLLDELVAVQFLGLPDGESNWRAFDRWQVDHIDGDDRNCAADNLQWSRIRFEHDDTPGFRAAAALIRDTDRTGKGYRRSVRVGAATGPHRPLVFTSSWNIPGHRPIASH